MSDSKITLNRKQIAFVVYMTEIKDPKEAIKKFASIMMEEKIHPSNMAMVIDRIFEKRERK